MGAQMLHPPDRSAGFSLIEVLVTFVILSLVVTACLQVYATSTRTQVRAQQSEAAFALLRERQASFESLELTPGASARGEAPGSLRWAIEVSEPAPDPAGDIAGRSIVWIRTQIVDGAGRTYSATTSRWLGEAFGEPPQ